MGLYMVSAEQIVVTKKSAVAYDKFYHIDKIMQISQ